MEFPILSVSNRAGDRYDAMRLWSLHPTYLDTRGLVAAWREGLLAQAVLGGRTTGYRAHPQLQRFRRCPAPVGAIATYLHGLYAESLARGYCFDAAKISRARYSGHLRVTRGQLDYEWRHLLAKLVIRDPDRHRQLRKVECPRPHPLFRAVAGSREDWEKG